MNKLVILLALLHFPGVFYAQQFVPNFDESKIPFYTLPNPLISESGKKIETVADWQKIRRPEILGLFEREVYGKSPAKAEDMYFKVLSEDQHALDGKAICKQVAVYYTRKSDEHMNVLIYLPKDRKNNIPIFFGLNFKGNHTVHPDPQIIIPETRGNNDKLPPRGDQAHRWPIDMILKSGYGVATVYRGDIDPDFHDGFRNGVHPLFYAEGQTAPKADEWATLAAWAWGMSCAMDYFVTDPDIDEQKVAIVGHSRHGKTTLWAGAMDERFAIVISNNSGCGGAALSRRQIGETVKRINDHFPHWFCENFKKYNENENNLPVDQHQLIALIAPRPVYIASAEEDTWADPKGEFLSGLHAGPIYELLGKKGLPVNEMPELNHPVQSGDIAYHIRTGKHDINAYDWQQYILFADKYFK